MYGDGDVIEDAEPRAFAAESMMSAAGKVAAPAAFECISSGGERAAHRSKRPIDEALRPGEADAAHRSLGQCAIEDVRDVFSVVYQLDTPALGEGRALEFED